MVTGTLSWVLRQSWVVTGVVAIVLAGLLCAGYGLWRQRQFWVWHEMHPEYVIMPGLLSARLKVMAPYAAAALLVVLGATVMLEQHSRKRLLRGAGVPRRLLAAAAMAGLGGVFCAIFSATKVIDRGIWESKRPIEDIILHGGFVAYLWLWPSAKLLWKVFVEWKPVLFESASEERQAKMRAVREEGEERSDVRKGVSGVVLVAGFLGVVGMGSLLFPDEVTLSYLLGAGISWAVGPLWLLWRKTGKPRQRVVVSLLFLCVPPALVYVFARHPAPPVLVGLLAGAVAGTLFTFTVRRKV